MKQPSASTVQLMWFTYLHALASFVHFPWPTLHQGEPSLHYGTALLSLVMIVVAWARPGDLRALVALCLVQLLDVALLMPVVPNHWLLTAVADVTIVISFVATRGAADTLGRLREPMAWGVAIFYFYTGIWKLTDQWFDPAVSCGAHAWNRLAAQFGMPEDGLGVTTAIYMTLVIELLGPVGLVWRKTRGWVVFCFVAFHIVLGLDVIQNFMNFSTVMMGLLVLLLDEDAFERVAGVMPLLKKVAIAWIVVALGVQLLAFTPELRPRFLLIRWLAWVTNAAFVLGVFGMMAGARFKPRSTLALAWLFPVLIVANGAAPIFGLKTRNSWQMYSNLRLEADVSNHLFLPPSLDMLGHLSASPVTVLDVSDAELHSEWVVEGRQITWYMFHNALAEHPNASVSYERDGVKHEVARVADRPELMERSSAIQRWYVWYRPLGDEVANTCQW